MLSRAYSYDMLGSFVAMPVGQLAYGPLGAAFGYRDVLVVSGVAYVAIALLTLLSRSVRDLPRRHETRTSRRVSQRRDLLLEGCRQPRPLDVLDAVKDLMCSSLSASSRSRRRFAPRRSATPSSCSTPSRRPCGTCGRGWTPRRAAGADSCRGLVEVLEQVVGGELDLLVPPLAAR